MAVNLLKKGSILLIKGIDTSMPAEYIESATNSVNMEVFESILQKRRGYNTKGSIIGGTNKEIMNGVIFRREDADYNIRIGRDKIEKYNNTLVDWDDITGDDLTGSSDNIISLATPLLGGQPILCFTNSVDPIRKWTALGNTVLLGGDPPNGKFIQEYKTYLVVGNITGGIDLAQGVQWSDSANPEEWSSGNAGSRSLEEDNKDITGLNIFGNYLCVHKETSIYLGYLVNTDNIFQFDRKNTGVGTVANNSIVNLPTGEQVFVSLDGIRIFNGISAPLIDSPINEEIRQSINRQYAFKSWGCLVLEKDEVWLGVPIGSEIVGQTIFKYNYVKKVIYKDVIANATVAWVGSSDSSITWDQMMGTWDENNSRWNDTALNEGASVINIGRNDGYVISSDDTALSDGGSKINGFYDTKDYQDSQETISRFSELQVWMRGTGTVDIYYSIDEGNTWYLLYGSPLTLTAVFPQFDDPQILYLDVVATKIRFRFQNNTATDSLYIKQFILGYKNVGNRR